MTRSFNTLLGIAIAATLMIAGPARAQFGFGGIKVGGSGINFGGKSPSMNRGPINWNNNRSSNSKLEKAIIEDAARTLMQGRVVGTPAVINPVIDPVIGRPVRVKKPAVCHPITICPPQPEPIVEPDPIVVTPPAPVTDQQIALELTYQAQEAFASGNYESAVATMNRVLTLSPESATAYQFRGLSHFAMGNYDEAAADVYDAVLRGPIWTWDAVHPLYSQASDYTQQYRALSRSAKSDEASMSKHFLLAYHHLVLGHLEHGEKELQRVLVIQPQEPVTQQLLTAVENRKTQQLVSQK